MQKRAPAGSKMSSAIRKRSYLRLRAAAAGFCVLCVKVFVSSAERCRSWRQRNCCGTL